MLYEHIAQMESGGLISRVHWFDSGYAYLVVDSIVMWGVPHHKREGDFMAGKGKCSEKPPRRGTMTVKVKGYTREDGTKVDPHKRHKPK